MKNLKGKTALVRVDFNVPIKNGKVLDDFRIKKALPTIKFLQKKGAKVVLISHLGEDGTRNMKPVANCLRKYIKKDITLLENIRKYPGEKKNDLKFAKKLAKLGDFYVNDAFSVSHRQHASIVGIPKYLPSYAGFQLEEEVKNLSKVVKNPKHPFLFILGGAKFSTKMPLIKKYLKLADYVFIGGALANDFLKAKGYEVGKSLVDNTEGIKNILKSCKLILPIDVVVKNDTNSAMAEFVSLRKVNEVKKNEIIIDIGPSTEKILAPIIKKSKLILWNGPLGKYEEGGDKATKKLLRLVLKSKSQVVIGGGDIVTVLSKLEPRNYRLKPNIFVSTGGGATLDFLAHGTLPGIKALK
jgi:phosphoglycerate kinase